MSAALAADARQESAAFYWEWSSYVDGFMRNRSVLRSALFPDKPEQMWFGYVYTRAVMGPLTTWLRPRLAPAELGARMRVPVGPANGLHVVGAIWNYMFASLGAVLEGQRVDADEAADVLDYWRGVYAAYTERWDPPCAVPPAAGPFHYRVIEDAEAAALGRALQPHAGEEVQRTIAALANYSWLMEAESRQGTFSHGLYRLEDGSQLLFRTFGDPQGSTYPWLADRDTDVPAGPIALLLGLRGVDVRFDALGVPSLQPGDYADRVAGVGVLTQDGLVEDCYGWLDDLQRAIAKDHRGLYGIAMSWSRADRFIAGARSYARLWMPFVRLAGGSEDDVRRLVLDPLDRLVEEALPAHVAAEGVPEIWTWSSRTDRPTVFGPLLEAIGLEREPA